MIQQNLPISNVSNSNLQMTQLESFSADPFQNKSNLDELERRISDIRSGKSILKEHDLIDSD